MRNWNDSTFRWSSHRRNSGTAGTCPWIPKLTAIEDKKRTIFPSPHHPRRFCVELIVLILFFFYYSIVLLCWIGFAPNTHTSPLGRSRKDKHKKKYGVCRSGLKNILKVASNFFYTLKYLRYPSAWKTGKSSHFSYIFTNCSPFLNHKINYGAWAVYNWHQDLSFIQNSFVYFNF